MQNLSLAIPQAALHLLDCLQAGGFAAYLVGGCVRDSLLGRVPGDWDIATSARPEQVKACCPGHPVLDTGLAHGTVTVLVDHVPYEVTTFRVDGAYSDHRRPDRVEFVDDLRADLARRDFTVNALAYHPAQGLVDYFGGREDLAAGRIVCVGDASVRFSEDALRILRAVRFASTLEFAIAPGTRAAMAALAPSLRHVAPERMRAELDKALVGPGMHAAFAGAQDVFCAVFPELAHRIRSAAWPQILAELEAAPPDVAVRLALLIGGGGEPAAILRRLRYDNATRQRVERLLLWQDHPAQACPASVRRWLHRLGEADFRRLLALWRARGDAQPVDDLFRTLDTVLAQGQCYRLRDLAVGGDDLLALGVPQGKPMGRMLAHLLDAVIDGRLPNERGALLAEVTQHLRQ